MNRTARLLYRAGFALTTVDEDLGLYEVIMMTGARGREIMNRIAATIKRSGCRQVSLAPTSTHRTRVRAVIWCGRLRSTSRLLWPAQL